MATPEQTILDLELRLGKQKRWCEIYDGYYEGEQPLKYMAPAMQAELGDRITQLVLNWARIGADAYENRLDVEGFRFPNSASGDEELWQWWQENNGDEQSQEGHLDSVALGRSFVAVGVSEYADSPPVFTIESPMQMVTDRDPRTRRVNKALKRWVAEDGLTQWATLWLPGYRGTYRLKSGAWVLDSRADTYDIGRGRIPIVPLINRPRTMRPDGKSEFHDVIPIADAANKMATDMMISGEFHAMPRRWAFGLKAEDFQDEQGNPLSSWSIIAGRLWANENPEVKVGQFDEADLSVFHNTIKLLAQLAGQQLSLPPDWLGFNTGNPASADAIRSAETQLVKRVERKHTFLGGAWEEVMRLMLRYERGAWVDEANRLETVWRDPSTPTIAQKADAVVKLATAMTADGRAILPLEQARIDLGYTDVQRTKMTEMDQEAAMNPAVQQILNKTLDPTPPVEPNVAVGA